MDNILKYSVELMLLNQLFAKALITYKEYIKIKESLMRDYKIE